jgi:hypothetical protein
VHSNQNKKSFLVFFRLVKTALNMNVRLKDVCMEIGANGFQWELLVCMLKYTCFKGKSYRSEALQVPHWWRPTAVIKRSLRFVHLHKRNRSCSFFPENPDYTVCVVITVKNVCKSPLQPPLIFIFF